MKALLFLQYRADLSVVFAHASGIARNAGVFIGLKEFSVLRNRQYLSNITVSE